MNFSRWKNHPELFGILLGALTLSQAASLVSFHANSLSHNLFGIFGYVSAYFWFFLFGPVGLLGVIGLGTLSFILLRQNLEYSSRKHFFAALTTLFSLSMLLCLLGILFPSVQEYWHKFLSVPSNAWQFPLGGVPMTVLYQHIPYLALEKVFSLIGTALFTCTALFISLVLLFNVDLSTLWSEKKEAPPKKERKRSEKEEEEEEPERFVRFGDEEEIPVNEPPKKRHISLGTDAIWNTPAGAVIPLKKPTDFSSYILPSTDLLNASKKIDLSELKEELKGKADLLEATLMNFGIEAKVGQIHCGPTITLYEVHPAVGVKVGKIKTLEHDIALNMEAKSIRIIAPIPGKAAVGIEIPNAVAQEVSFREVLAAYQQRGSPFKIPMLLGKSVNGELVISDLTKMPHCIIAGATGSGKSVCINSIVMSILMLARPDEIRFLMIDPKKVELTPYSELPHMLAPVITEPHTAAASLNWLVREMEKRYEILRLTAQRHIDAFNKRKIDMEKESQAHVEIPKHMPYIIGIIDELADLMMVANQDVEAPIARIAQMARAVGIHLIVATQRPSREVITGLIKANFPARISFKVASRINSQIVLDDIGAETLLGNGDMLIQLPGSSQLIRAQGVFVRDEEINKVISSITAQHPPKYTIESLDKLGMSSADAEDMELDDLYEEAKSIVLSTGNASTTFLQRKLKVGYARAASLMDQLELQGIVSPQEGARPRRVFFPKGSSNGSSSEEEYSEET